MNILIAHNFYKIPGGEDVAADNERRLLEEAGHKVIWYTRHNDELDRMPLYQKLMLPLSFVYSQKTVREVRTLIRQEKIDIVMVHNTLLLISPSIYYAAVRENVPVLQTIHNFRLLCPGATFYREGHICEDCTHGGLLPALRHRCYRGSRFMTLACAFCLHYHRWRGIYRKLFYICLTEFNRQKLLTAGGFLGINPDRVFVKPNFTRIEGEIVPYAKRGRYMLYAGRLDETKGIPELLKAWTRLGEEAPELKICGNGPLAPWCREYLADHKTAKVSLSGSLPHEEVLKLIGNAQALLLPSKWYEGLPMVIVEAFMLGTPVIGSGIGNVGEAVSSEKLGRRIGMTGDADQLAAAIAEAVVSFRETFRYEEEAFREAAARYSAEENLKILERIFQDIRI
ncbi:MAG: glycosyltransferase family 4 protein [Lachnospiraceae bacterium]|nr:glycosyltransferase family 4 protein [Lachnospiraceae bacterium]